ncbi:MAG: hypothetical protein KDK62_06505 [Chlamydiia bacterium]|nr:hypothetical protein [Chlamydiia bacterium]
MQRKVIKYLNTSILGVSLLFAMGAAFLWLIRPGEILEEEPKPIKVQAPTHAFALSQDKYQEIKSPVFSLHFEAPKVKLPDLKNILVYYGKNGRPDAQKGSEMLHFSINGAKETVSLSPGEKLYLTYNKRIDGARYGFSPNNAPTGFWIEAEPKAQEAEVFVHLLDANGKPVKGSEDLANFYLPEKEFARNSVSGWELGKYRVDATLLARQKAKWVGMDKFLEEHGGEEYQDVMGRQRVDFGEGEETYSLFVKPGDSLIWGEDRWQLVEPGDASRGQPLLVVKRVDERLMNLELWDAQGKGKVVLNLLRSADSYADQNFEKSFKFVGARTRSQYVFEIDNERMLLRPQDWLLLTEGGWKKLSTPKEIDDYVDRKLTGTLFVFDSISKKDEKQVIKGTVYNNMRTESYPLELATQSNPIPEKKPSKSSPESGKLRAQEAVGKSRYKVEPPSYAKEEQL